MSSTPVYFASTTAPGDFWHHEATPEIARVCVPGPKSPSHLQPHGQSPTLLLSHPPTLPEGASDPGDRRLAVPNVTIADSKAESDCLLGAVFLSNPSSLQNPEARDEASSHPCPGKGLRRHRLPRSVLFLPTGRRQPWQGLWTRPWPAVDRFTADGILFLPWAHTLCRMVDSAPGLLSARQTNGTGDVCTHFAKATSAHITPFVGGREKQIS